MQEGGSGAGALLGCGGEVLMLSSTVAEADEDDDGDVDMDWTDFSQYASTGDCFCTFVLTVSMMHAQQGSDWQPLLCPSAQP